MVTPGDVAALQHQFRQELADSAQRIREEVHTTISGRIDTMNGIFCLSVSVSVSVFLSLSLSLSLSLDARLELFWAEDWSALWAMVRAECDVAPVQNTTRRTDKQQLQSRVRKVATLARTGEKRASPSRCQKCTTSSSHGADCSRDQDSSGLTQNHQLLCKPQCEPYFCLK